MNTTSKGAVSAEGGGVNQIDPQSRCTQRKELAPVAPEQQRLSTWETR